MIELILGFAFEMNLSGINYNEVMENILFENYKQEYIGKRLSYGLGCTGKHTGCKSNRFDCSGLIKNILLKNRIINKSNLGKRNSRCIYESGTPKNIKNIDPGDYVYFESKTGVNHIAIASRIYDNGIWIYDSLKGEVKERFIKTNGYYMGMYKIYVSEFKYGKQPKCKQKK